MSFVKKKKDQGLLGFYGLYDWFQGLSKREQSAIREIYEQMSGEDASDLDSVKIETSETSQGFLGSIATGLIAQKDYALGELVLQKALSAKSADPWDRHFIYDRLIEIYYKRRDEQPDALDKCIIYCIEDIEIAEDVIDAHREEIGIPRILSFDRLAIIYEKQGNYQAAIQVCQRAIELSLPSSTKGGFPGRLAKLEKKLQTVKP